MTITPALRAQDAFERALKTYKEQLTEKELKKIEVPTSLDDLLRGGAVICGNKEKAKQRIEKLEKLRIHIKPYEQLMSGVCKLAPKGGDLIWASVAFVLDTVKNLHDELVKVLDFFVEMSERLKYIASLESSFGDAPLMRGPLEATYVAIISFWVEAVRYYRITFTKTAFKISLSGSITKKFETLKEELDKQHQKLSEIAAAQHYADFAKTQRRVDSFMRTKRTSDMSAWIAAPGFEVDFSRADKKRHSGTCEWIHGRKEYETWRTGERGSLLVIYGIPGAGKTILSSYLIRDAQNSSPERIVLYHYFKADDTLKNTPLSAMRSILYQLFEYATINNLEEVERSLYNEMETRRHRTISDHEVLWSIFSSVVSKHKLLVKIVLDAIDECKSSKSFVRELHRHCSIEPTKIVITGRKSGAHVDEFAKSSSAHVIEMTEEDVKHDIASFVHYKINKIERLRSARDKRLRENVIAEFGKVANHKGMFLWAYLMCKEVKDTLKVSAIWKLLTRLPPGLNEVYGKILVKLNELSPELRNFSKLVLRWIIGSYRPLRFAELEQALRTANPEDELFDDEDDEDYGLRWSRKDIVRVCGSFVSYTGLEEGDYIRVIHLSARDFLRDVSASDRLPPGCADFLVDLEETSIQIAGTCLNFLSNDSLYNRSYFQSRGRLVPNIDLDPESPEALELELEEPFFQYAVRYWPDYIIEGHGAVSANTELLSSSIQNIHKVLIAESIASKTSVLWLEEYVRAVGPIYTVSVLQRLLRAISETPIRYDDVIGDLIDWLTSTEVIVQEYGTSLSQTPHLIHNFFDIAIKGKSAQKLQPRQVLGIIEDTLWRLDASWLHVDLRAGYVLALERFADTIRIHRSNIMMNDDGSFGGEKENFRSMVETGESIGSNKWMVRSAVVKDRGTFVAVTACPDGQEGPLHESSYRTVCWSVLGGAKSNEDWAEVAFVEKVDGTSGIFRDPIRIFQGEGCASVLAFGDDNTLLTPGGIWSVLLEKMVARPEAIYEPDASLEVQNTCFSGNGKMVARTRRCKELEFLGIEGNSILQHEFPAGTDFTDQLKICAVSHTGNNVLVVFRESVHDLGRTSFKHRRGWFSLSRKSFVEFNLPSSVRIQYPQFTKTEDMVIARLIGLDHSGEDEDMDTSGRSIAAWRIVDGVAQMVYIYKSLSNLMFTIFGNAKKEEIAIYWSGSIQNFSASKTWSIEDEASFKKIVEANMSSGKRDSCIVDNRSTDQCILLIAQCGGLYTSNPKVKFASLIFHWEESFCRPTYTLVHLTDSPELPLESKESEDFSLSPRGNYLSVKGQIREVIKSAEQNEELEEAFNELEIDEASEDLDDKVFIGLGGRLPLPGTEVNQVILSNHFTEDESRVAVLKKSDQGEYILALFNVIRDSSTEPTPNAAVTSFELDGDFLLEYGDYRKPVDFRLVFNPQDSNKFLVSYWTMDGIAGAWLIEREDDRNFNRTQIEYEFMAGITFSLCGRYIHKTDVCQRDHLIPWPTATHLESPPQTVVENIPLHPRIIAKNATYMINNDFYRLRHDVKNGVIYLQHRVLDCPTHRSRAICVTADQFAPSFVWSQLINYQLFWPEDDEKEVSLVVLPEKVEQTHIIYTGIRAGNLLGGGDWFEDQSTE